MSNEMTSGSASFSEMKDKLFSEFDKMSLILQEEKNKFEEQMTRRRKDFDLELQNRLAELATEKEELKDAKDQFQKEKDKFTKELEKKTITLQLMKDEIEQKTKSHIKETDKEAVQGKAKEVERLKEATERYTDLETANKGLAKQKLTLEVELANLRSAHKKEEDHHFQKMAAYKNELETLNDEIEQKLFFAADKKKGNFTKKSRQLIITTVTGETYRGNINIGSKERLSDMFTKVKIPFIVMYDAKFKGEEQATVIINKQSIVSVKPLD